MCVLVRACLHLRALVVWCGVPVWECLFIYAEVRMKREERGGERERREEERERGGERGADTGRGGGGGGGRIGVQTQSEAGEERAP